MSGLHRGVEAGVSASGGAQPWFEDLSAATARALAREPGLRFRGHRLHKGRKALAAGAPHLMLDDAPIELATYRALTDGYAQRLNYSDPDIHRLLAPRKPLNRLVFEILEQFRVEALVPATLPGMRTNLAYGFRRWVDAYEHSGMIDSDGGLLIMTIALMCRSQVVGEAIPAHLEGRLEAVRAELGPIFADDIVGLRRQLRSQRAYGMHAVAIARMLAERVTMVDNDRNETDTANAAAGEFALWLDFDDHDSDGGVADDGLATGRRGPREAAYGVFTTAYDEQVDPHRLVRQAQLIELRERLDERLRAQPVSVARVARMLQARLAEPTYDDWVSEQEAGQVDGRRLSRLVSTPGEHRVFRRIDDPPLADALITLLIDCSGSMKAVAAEIGTLVEVVARAAELAGVHTEILGFTTRSWDGGQARRDWQRAGRPPNPGRLAELRHIVFKSADQRLRRRRRALAALLKPDLFREGVDGEAVQWACQRSLAFPAQKRIVAVLSDGSPMEGATQRCNPGDPLDIHLADTVDHYSGREGLRIVGLGVGLDLSPYYRNRLALSLDKGLDNPLLWRVVQAIAPVGHGR